MEFNLRKNINEIIHLHQSKGHGLESWQFRESILYVILDYFSAYGELRESDYNIIEEYGVERYEVDWLLEPIDQY